MTPGLTRMVVDDEKETEGFVFIIANWSTP